MAKSLVWADLSADQLQGLRNAEGKGPAFVAALLAKYTGITDVNAPKNAIILDMYSNTLRFGKELQLSDDKLSCLFSIMKEVHRQATHGRMPVDRSFAHFKQLMLAHSVQRPPYSIAVFTLQEFKKILDWALDTYYRHYKLYQYAFTDRVVMSPVQCHPSDDVELPPQGGVLPPLAEALTWEQHTANISEEERKREEEKARAAAEAAAAAEADRLARLQEEYEAAIPDEVRDRVAAVVEKELARLKQAMEAQFQSQTQELLSKIAALETKTAS